MFVVGHRKYGHRKYGSGRAQLSLGCMSPALQSSDKLQVPGLCQATSRPPLAVDNKERVQGVRLVVDNWLLLGQSFLQDRCRIAGRVFESCGNW